MSKIIKPFESPAFQKARKFEQQAFPLEPEPNTADRSPHVQSKEAAFAHDPSAIIAEATAKGQEILAKAAADAVQVRNQAHEQGYAEGFTKGSEEARKKQEERAQADALLLDSLVNELKAQEVKVMRMLSPRLADLAAEIALKVIHREIRSDPLLVASQAEEAIKKILERDRLIIRVNPADEGIMKSYKAELISMFDGIDKIEVIGDAAVEQGGCIVETHLVKVDAQPSSQVQAARKAFSEMK